METKKTIYQWLALSWLFILIGASLIIRFKNFESFNEVNVEKIFELPSQMHWLGTDSLGRDFLTRILKGSGISLLIGFQSLVISILISFFYGGLSGWLGKRYDTILMIFLDIWMSIPATVLAAIVGLLLMNHTDSILMVSIVIGSTHWGRMARLVRGEAMRLREKTYIQSSVALGASSYQILRTHFIPHLITLFAIYVIYQIPSLILAESFLSFIGIGVQSPETSWGILLSEGWRSFQVFPHVVFFPAGFLFLTILSLNSIMSKSENR